MVPMWTLTLTNKEIEYLSLTVQKYLGLAFYSSDCMFLTMMTFPPLGPIPRATTIG
jgi:hypothetical protein